MMKLLWIVVLCCAITVTVAQDEVVEDPIVPEAAAITGDEGNPADPADPPEDAAPEDAAPEDAAPEDAAPEDAAPEDAAPEDAAPEDAAADESAGTAADETADAEETEPDDASTAVNEPPIVPVDAGTTGEDSVPPVETDGDTTDAADPADAAAAAAVITAAPEQEPVATQDSEDDSSDDYQAVDSDQTEESEGNGAAPSQTLQPGDNMGAGEGSTAPPEAPTTSPPEPTTTETITTEPPTTEPPFEMNTEGCPNFTRVYEDHRHFTNNVEDKSDTWKCESSSHGWVVFFYGTQPAKIPTTYIQAKHCGTFLPMYIRLDGETLPDNLTSIEASLCPTHMIDGHLAKCVFRDRIEIFNCHGYYMYNYNVTPEVCQLACVAGHDEHVPTDEDRACKLNSTAVEDLEEAQDQNTVTFVFDEPKQRAACVWDENFRARLAQLLNNFTEPDPITTASPEATAAPTTAIYEQVEAVEGEEEPDDNLPPIPDGDTDAEVKGPAGRRRRRRSTSGGGGYTADCIRPVGEAPSMSEDGKMKIAVYAQCEQDTEPADQEALLEAATSLKDSQDPNGDPEEVWTHSPILEVYGGHDQQAPSAMASDDTVWDRHKGLLITIIVLLIICLIVIIIGLLCLKCRCCQGDSTEASALERGEKPEPMVRENPIPDEEMLKGEAPMVRAAAPQKQQAPPPTAKKPPSSTRPAQQPATKKQPSPKKQKHTPTKQTPLKYKKDDDNNGWIVPLDQTTIQDTKF